MKILNTPLTQKRPRIRTKRPKQEPNPQTKKGAIRRASRMNVTLRLYFDLKLVLIVDFSILSSGSGTKNIGAALFVCDQLVLRLDFWHNLT